MRLQVDRVQFWWFRSTDFGAGQELMSLVLVSGGLMVLVGGPAGTTTTHESRGLVPEPSDVM